MSFPCAAVLWASPWEEGREMRLDKTQSQSLNLPPVPHTRGLNLVRWRDVSLSPREAHSRAQRMLMQGCGNRCGKETPPHTVIYRWVGSLGFLCLS